jgi:hypothetical protein
MDVVFETTLEKEYSVPTWQALEWLMEDFGVASSSSR